MAALKQFLRYLAIVLPISIGLWGIIVLINKHGEKDKLKTLWNDVINKLGRK